MAVGYCLHVIEGFEIWNLKLTTFFFSLASFLLLLQQDKKKPLIQRLFLLELLQLLHNRHFINNVFGTRIFIDKPKHIANIHIDSAL